MEWTSIEKKWHDMARRLQTTVPVTPRKEPADAKGADSASPPPDDLAAPHRLDTRAMA